ncbi:MAG: MoaD/ThiS family protein [Planctomycetaceae bacterium]
MDLELKLFARARDLAGAETIIVSVPERCLVLDVRRALSEQFPNLTPILPSLLIAVDNQYVTDSMPVGANADIACFPPVSGG